MNQLPVDEVLPELLRSLGTSGRLVLRAPPGSGKTTRVALSLLDSDLTGDGVVLLLQPRRAAARSVARYLARVRGGRLGAEVGYQVRFDSKVSSQTRLKVVTEGILIRMLQGDPEL
ncbi:MAG: ATP-dependent helicase HrpB, partial [Myxococcota bacterium]|nr:ATP-dependent helicase HrpB [Myxococcota bacterium]